MIDFDSQAPVQKEIYKAITQMSEKNTITESQIAKKIRENTNFSGKKKAGIGLNDLMIVLDSLRSEEIFYSIHITSVNECLLKKETSYRELSLESKQRRQKSEKSMSIITSGDISQLFQRNLISHGDRPQKNSKTKHKERKKLSVYDDYED